MRNYLFVCAVAFLGCVFYSCVKCQCEPVSIPDFDGKFVNRQDQNLVFGPQAVYRLDSLKVLKKPNDFSVENAFVQKSYRDSSAVFFSFYSPAAKNFLYFNRQTTGDSLEITWMDEKRKCCGEPFIYHAIQQVKFNGTVVQPQNGIYVFVK